jgi:hypothetical protein
MIAIVFAFGGPFYGVYLLLLSIAFLEDREQGVKGRGFLSTALKFDYFGLGFS